MPMPTLRHVRQPTVNGPGEAHVATCDAGGCNRTTDAIVETVDGWVSMCRGHAILALAGMDQPGRLSRNTATT